MGMTIDEAIDFLEESKYSLYETPSSCTIDIATSIMRKYQKIEQILNDWENSGEKDDPINIIDNIEEVIEDENDD